MFTLYSFHKCHLTPTQRSTFWKENKLLLPLLHWFSGLRNKRCNWQQKILIIKGVRVYLHLTRNIFHKNNNILQIKSQFFLVTSLCFWALQLCKHHIIIFIIISAKRSIVIFYSHEHWHFLLNNLETFYSITFLALLLTIYCSIFIVIWGLFYPSTLQLFQFEVLGYNSVPGTILQSSKADFASLRLQGSESVSESKGSE